MNIVKTSFILRGKLRQHKRIAFVPTMGNFHQGHLELIETAKHHADCVVVSIFVNPLQFGPNEDFDTYPRSLEADCAKLKTAGVSYVFTPSITEMYPNFDGKSFNQQFALKLPSVANELCGVSRPGHFPGVAMVITKLFNMVNPNVAVFGKKDFQQLFIIRKLVKQFNFPIEIIPSETVRESSGLAMSSRNNNLNSIEKTQATKLYLVLNEVVNSVAQGNQDFIHLEQNATNQLLEAGWDVDYISIRSSITLEAVQKNQKNLVILGAATLLNTRLIDNIEFNKSHE